MSMNLKFNKTLVATMVSVALLSACEDETTVEPAQVTVTPPEVVVEAPEVVVEAPAVEAPVSVIIEDEALAATVSGSVVNGKSRAAITGLTVEIHVNGMTTETVVTDNGSFVLANLPINSDYMLVVSDETGMYAPAYFRSTTGEAGQMLQPMPVFNAVTTTITIDDVTGGNVSGLTMYIPGEDLATVGLAAKGYMVNVPDIVATEVDGVYSFVLPDNDQNFDLVVEIPSSIEIVNGAPTSITAGTDVVEHAIEIVEKMALEYTLNFHAMDQSGEATFLGETLEFLVGGVSVMATQTATGEYTATVGYNVLEAGMIYLPSTGEYQTLTVDALNAGPVEVNVTATESTFADLENSGEILPFAAEVVSERLIEGDQFQVVVEFTQPASLLTDVSYEYETIDIVPATFDLGRSFDNYSYTGSYPDYVYSYVGQGWLARAADAGDIDNGDGTYSLANTIENGSYPAYTFEVALQGTGNYESANAMNLNRYHENVWPSSFTGTQELGPQDVSIGSRGSKYNNYKSQYAGIAFANSGMNYHMRNDSAFNTANGTTFQIESSYYWNKALHTVKFVIDNVDGEQVVADRISYYTDDATEVTEMPINVVTDQQYYAGFTTTTTEQVEREGVVYAWNDNKTVLTITGDVNDVKAGITYNLSTQALSLHDNSVIDINATLMAEVATEYTLDNLTVDNGDYYDTSTFNGWVLDFSEDENGEYVKDIEAFREADTNVEYGKVYLPNVTTNKVGSTYALEGYIVLGGNKAKNSIPGYTDFYNMHNNYGSAIEINGGSYNPSNDYKKQLNIVSPIEFDGFMKITSVTVLYAPTTSGGPCTGICSTATAEEYAASVEETYAVDGTIITFGEINFSGAGHATHNEALLYNASGAVKLNLASVDSIKSIYGSDNLTVTTGFAPAFDNSIQHVYSIPNVTATGGNWIKAGNELIADTDSTVKAITAEVNFTIDGKQYQETRTFTVQ